MDEAIFAPSKQERQVAVDVIKEEATAACEEKFGEEFDPDHVKMAFEIIQEEVYRDNILQKGNAPMDAGLPTCAKSAVKRAWFHAFTDPPSLPAAKRNPLS